MTKKFYYAVRNGVSPGIYFTWEDCKKQVDGFKGAEYKKFSTLEEANNFIHKETDSIKEKHIDIDKIDIQEKEGIAYVDGSYNTTTKECGFGVVLFTSKGKKTFYEKVEEKRYSSYRNVTGEIFGSIFAIEKSIEYKLKKIYIHYDYTGIKNWALGDWKANNELTKLYKAEFNKLKDKIEVKFIKVKAHTGNKYNEEADLLAKKSVGL